MLGAMRKHSESFIIYLIFGAIIVVFAFSFGPGSGSCREASDPSFAAKVNGEPISVQSFALNYNYRVELQRRRMQMANMEFSAEMLERLGIRRQVIDELIDQKLLAQEARNWGLRVSESDLREYLLSRYPVLDQLESRRQYENWVARNFESTVQRFEANTRDEILGQRIHKLLVQSVSISEEEIRADYLREHDRVMITYVKFDPSDFTPQEPTAADIAEVLANDFPAVEAKYNSEVLRYRTPEKRQARQIVRQLPADASEADVAKARGLLLELKSQIEGGADFGALAKEHSQDGATREAGGDLGEIQRGDLPAELEKVVFKMRQDELTAEPVRTETGLYLIQVTKVIPPARRKLDEVKEEVAAVLLRERRASEMAAKRAQAFLDLLKAGRSMTEVTLSEEEAREKPNASKPTRHDTPWILKAQKSIPRIGESEELHAAVFALSKAQPIASSVYEVNRAYFVVTLKERETPDLKKFEEEKESLRRSAVAVKQGRVLRSWVSHLRDNAVITYNEQLFPPLTANSAEGRS